jgi:hypothetical protein
MNAFVHSNAAVIVRPVVLPRAVWPRKSSPGGLSLSPVPGTWYAFEDKGDGPRGTIVRPLIPMISCPACAGLLFLSHTPEGARALGRMVKAVVPIAHRISHEGKVAPDIKCTHGTCSFHRTVYLDKWDKTRPLYCAAYCEGRDPEIKFCYSHATSPAEARLHLGPGDFTIVGIARAIGFAFDEKTRKFETM